MKALPSLGSLALFIFAIINTEAHACSCYGADNFAQTAREYLQYSTAAQPGGRPFLGVVKILSHKGRQMSVEVVEKFMGADTLQSLTVRGDNGASCAPYVEHFPIGSVWLIYLNSPIDKIYDVSNCGVHYLPVVDGQIIGKLHSTDRAKNQHPTSALIDIVQSLEREAQQHDARNAPVFDIAGKTTTSCKLEDSRSFDRYFSIDPVTFSVKLFDGNLILKAKNARAGEEEQFGQVPVAERRSDIERIVVSAGGVVSPSYFRDFLNRSPRSLFLDISVFDKRTGRYYKTETELSLSEAAREGMPALSISTKIEEVIEENGVDKSFSFELSCTQSWGAAPGNPN